MSRGHLSGRSGAAIDAVLPLATAIVRSSLAQEQIDGRVEEQTSEIALLYEMSRSLGFAVHPEEVFDLIDSSLLTVLGARLCAFSIPGQDGEELSLHLSAAAGGLVVEDLRDQISAELSRLTGRHPSRTIVNVHSGDPVEGEVPFGQVGSPTHVPLLAHGEILGLLSVFPPEGAAFGEGRRRLLYTIANQASQTLDRLRTTQEAEDSKIHSMLESMADGVILLDGRLRPVMCNPAARSYLSIIKGREENGEPLESLGEVRLDTTLREMERAEAGPRTFDVLIEGRVFSVTCSPVKGLGDEIRGMVVVVSDITRARSLQEQLAQSEKLSAIGQMISGVAHELNNPLASVMGYAQLLQRERVDQEVKRKLDLIAREAKRCQRVVQDLLGFARLGAEGKSVIDLNETIESLAGLLGHQLELENIALDFDLQPRLSRVLGDPHSLRQVFINIIQNAQHAMAGRGGRVTVRTRGDERSIRAEIVDDGPGIPAENLKRIFDPFFTTKEVGKGTGLGLSLAYGTVKDHGGSIRVESRAGGGAIFSIELPAQGGVPETSDDPGAEVESGDCGDGMPPVRERGGRILVVEDEKSLADVMVEILQSYGHVIDTAGDGQTAWAMTLSHDYDLIITDLKMPNMNGREFYANVAKAKPALARRIIFSTGDTASPETRAFFKEVGNPFIRKPFNLADLVRMVDAALNRD
jgi:two-component system NtrC family sensor kinase